MWDELHKTVDVTVLEDLTYHFPALEEIRIGGKLQYGFLATLNKTWEKNKD